MIVLRKAETKKAYNTLQSQIINNKYKTGTFLPPERELSELLQISRKALRNVLYNLECEGYVRTIHGRGNIVCDKDNKRKLIRFIARSNPVGGLVNAPERERLLLGICKGAGKFNAESLVTFGNLNDIIPAAISRYNTISDIQGMIISGFSDVVKFIPRLNKSRIPYVIANLEQDVDAISTRVDFKKVGKMAGKYLLDHGHRKLGFIAGSLKTRLYREIFEGFNEVLMKNRVNLDKKWIVETQSFAKESRDVCTKILNASNRPTAFFTARDVRACGLFASCKELNIKIPDDISVISYDDISWPEAALTGLTSIKEPVESLGTVAVEILEKWVSTGIPPKSKILTCKLIERNSVKMI